MKIILPKIQSAKVTDFAFVEEDAKRMHLALLSHDFQPMHPRLGAKNAFALHHSQVEERQPQDFFVLNGNLLGLNKGQIAVVINPKILEKRGDRKLVKEGCLSFPFRADIGTLRYDKLLVEYWVPNKKGKLVREEREVEGIVAHVFQHEKQHAHCQHIYQKTK